MSQDIAARLTQYSSRAQQILSYLTQNTTASTPTTEVGKDILAWGAGEFVKDLLGSAQAGRYGKKLTKQYLKTEQQKQKEAIRRNCEGQFNVLVGEVRTFLSGVSIDSSRLTATGNTSRVLSKLAGVYSATKLETKIRKLVGILESLSGMPLIYNSEISRREDERKKKVRESSHDTLKRLETRLREVIEKELSAITPSWWKQRITNDVRTNAEARKNAHDNLWPWYSSTAGSPMSFLDFNDYAKIVARSDNWKDVFVKIFSEKELIQAKLRELDPLRKAVAHSRDLGPRDLARLEVIAGDIMAAIDKYYH